MTASEDTVIANATALLREGKAALAQPLVLRALQRSPTHPRLNTLAAQVFQRQGQKDQALYYAERACKAGAGQPAAVLAPCLWVLGEVLESRGDQREAVDTFERAVALEARSLPARQRIVQRLGDMGWFTRAVRHAREAVAIAPQNASAFNLLMNMLMASGDVRGALEAAEDLLRRQPEYIHAAIAAAFARNYLDGVVREENFAAHRRVGEIVSRAAGVAAAHVCVASDADRPLRIGIVSAEFREHSVSYFIEPILRYLDRRAFGVTCYSVGERDDARTRKLIELADAWRPCAAMDAATLAAAVRADRIDILIETSGLTRGNRLEALALRPAPVQVTYCGYPNTTGLAAIDYRVVDSLTDPPGSDRFHTEKLIRLDPCFLCYTPDSALPVAPCAFEAAGAVTFGSFNTLLKVTDRVFDTWVRIATCVPNGRLVLKGQQLADPETIEKLRACAERAGLSRERLELVDFTRTPEDHLVLYSKVDIALDPFPYNGTTTICEAAWMGVPTVTLRGECHASRVGASLLSAMGLPELIAADLNEYTRIAAALAADTGRLRSLRSTLRDRLKTSRLCDGPGFAGRFGEALRAMWRERCGS